MTADQARRWIILASLMITGIQIVFLFICPAIGFPLEYSKCLDLLQIITPVFLGYLGSAVHFVFMNPAPTVTVDNKYFGPLVKGPIIIYACAMLAAFATFGYSNRSGAPIGNAMTVANLSTSVSVSLGILAATTGVIVSYLFTGNRPQNPTAGTADASKTS
ncbi:hypothetical protein [Bradyrhizobium sp. AUGA SZCCT0182]|uniref:hypothetical protein n=1 Tax=Bradyrhizobium sp. AUGA SZCCT0182 TaxID=2807667 RepID=UPI001BA5358D|nr:hypothetical protein [Bradyrhizobium sp. AUGA SZCCT0182]MBR1233141.1 hypothetical protein [Bradyrhizobium sp. AUGA SZCCT0182]